MRYLVISVVIVAVIAIVVPSVYAGFDSGSKSSLAPATLSAPPTTVAETGSPGAARTPRPTASPATGAALGQQVATRAGCAACHSVNGTALIGPTWQGLAGRDTKLTSGETVTADDAYLQESIISPNAKVVDGYQPGIMPQDFGTRLTPDEIQAVIAYIHTLQ